MKIKNIILIFSIIFAVISCKNPISPEETNQKGSIQFSFGESTQLKSLGKTNETASAVLVTLTDSKGSNVFQLKKIDLVSFGGVYITQPIELSVGDYLVTEFVVIDQSNTALYASPKVGSPLASVVSKPLPIELNIQKDQVSNLKLEVVKVDDSVPEDFGYISFKFDIIETIDFLIAVSVYNSEKQGFELTESVLEVTYNTKSLYSETIPSLTNHVIIKNEGDSTVYELKISKTGYMAQTKQFTLDELKSFKSKPIIFVLEEGQEAQNNFVLVYTSNYESYYMKEDGTELTKFADLGSPVWMNDKKSVALQNGSQINIRRFSDFSLEKTINFNASVNGFSLWYSPFSQKFMFTAGGSTYFRIGVVDLEGNVNIVSKNYDIGNPVMSAADNWMYYLNKEDGTWDIHRMNSDGSSDEPITSEPSAFYGNFGVSYDGTLLVAPKIDGSKNYLSIINTGNKSESLIDVTSVGQLIGYTTITKDNQYIYFTATTNRNLFRIKIDGTDLKQLTFSTTTFHRAMAW